MQNRRKSLPVALALIALVMVMVGCSCANTGTNGGLLKNSGTETTKSGQITMAQYNQVENGMSYEEVVGIFGREGTELSSSDIAGYQNIVYSWENESVMDGYVTISIQNGEVISKAQFGLK